MLQLPQPHVGQHLGVPGQEELVGTRAELWWVRGRALGRRKVQGCAFLGAGSVLASVPATAGAPCSTWRGWGSLSLPRRVRGAQKDEQPAGDSEAPEPVESKLEPCAWQGSYLDSLQCGAQAGLVRGTGRTGEGLVRGTGRTGEGLVRGTGRAPWEAGTEFAAPRQEAATETPKQLCSQVVGR